MNRSIILVCLTAITITFSIVSASLWKRNENMSRELQFKTESLAACSSELERARAEKNELKRRAFQAETLLWKNGIR